MMKTKRNKKKIYYLIIFFMLNIVEIAKSESFIKKNTIQIKKNDKIGISETVYNRIEGYMRGKFYSKNLNRNLFQVSGVYMAISKNGSNSTISFCDADHFNLCAEQHLAFQTLKKCEKISKEKCYLIFRGNKFLPINNKKNIIINKYFYVKNKNLGQHGEIHGKTLEEFNIPDN